MSTRGWARKLQHHTRIKKACDPCRRRRRKCNGQLPCGQCTAYDYECVYPKKYAQQEGNTSDTVNNGGHHIDLESPQMTQIKSRLKEARPSVAAHALLAGAADKDQPRTKAPPFIDLEKGKYCNVNSGIALPRRVDIAMGLQANLRIQSYGWNTGIRTEPFSSLQGAICRYLSFSDMTFYSKLYFEIVDPVFHFIDKKRYLDRCSAVWSSKSPMLEDFEALVAGVVCLGSFFSHSPSPVEAQLLEHAKSVLDRGSAYGPGRLSLDQVAGWILRTLYLRLTTRAHPAWFASCATMHVAEAMALHADLDYISLTNKHPSLPSPEVIETRKSLFSCACFLNALISADAGRSKASLLDMELPRDERPTWMFEMTKILWELELTVSSESRQQRLRQLYNLETTEPALVLLKTDVTIHLFRKQVGLCHPRMDEEEVEIMLELFRGGLAATRTLLALRRPWWNVFHTPFQSLVVLLAIDRDDSLAMVQDTLSVLRVASETFPTKLATEVIQAAQRLVAGSKKRKLRQLRSLGLDNTSDSNHSEYALTTDQDSLRLLQADLTTDDWFSPEIDWSYLVEGHSATTENQDNNMFSLT